MPYFGGPEKAGVLTKFRNICPGSVRLSGASGHGKMLEEQKIKLILWQKSFLGPCNWKRGFPRPGKDEDASAVHCLD